MSGSDFGKYNQPVWLSGFTSPSSRPGPEFILQQSLCPVDAHGQSALVFSKDIWTPARHYPQDCHIPSS
ncbi:hypothetical protein AVEN_70641-1, partial [Araneus ventricosus]